MIRFNGGNADCRSYDRSLDGYAKMLEVPVPHIRKPGDMGCGFTCVALVALLIYFIGMGSLTQEQEASYTVPRLDSREYGLLVSNVLNNVVIPAPENSVEVFRGSETFVELEQFDEGKVIGLKRFYGKSTSGLEGNPLNGLLDVVITAPICVKQTWRPSSFRVAMEQERESIAPGKIISSQNESNYRLEDIMYDKYEMNSTCVCVSDISEKAFSFSALAEEKLVKEDQEITLQTLTTCRYILTKGRILMLRARDVFLDRDEAMRQIGEQGNRLEKWGEMIDARNIDIAD